MKVAYGVTWREGDVEAKTVPPRTSSHSTRSRRQLTTGEVRLVELACSWGNDDLHPAKIPRLGLGF